VRQFRYKSATFSCTIDDKLVTLLNFLPLIRHFMENTPADGMPLPQRYGAIITIALGIMMSVLDGAIANVALPTLSQELQASPASTIWVVNAYQMAIMVSLLSFSFLGDMVGYRRIYRYGLALFSLTSLMCALSPTLEWLIAARILQGFSAAAVMSVNTALIRLIYPRAQLGRGLAINALIVAVSAAAGPTVAAAILSVATWHWLFLINLPIGVVGLILALRWLPANTEKQRQRFDLPSALMNALTFGLLIGALSGFAQGQPPLLVAGECIALLIIGTLFVRRQLRLEVPLLPVDLLRIPVFSLSMATSICSFTAQMLALVALPFWMQGELGRSEVETGLLLTPWPIATMLVAPVAGRLIEHVHAGLLGALGLLLFTVGLAALALLTDTPGDMDIIWRMALCGVGFALFQSPNNHTLISSAPRNRSGGASGMLGTARLTGQSIGAALVALMFNLFNDSGTQSALWLAAAFACIAAIISSLRLSQPRSRA
jgi:DHA2 family multidrug resistance protein-like MFS transporter